LGYAEIKIPITKAFQGGLLSGGKNSLFRRHFLSVYNKGFKKGKNEIRAEIPR
jgi:hypothetical protein